MFLLSVDKIVARLSFIAAKTGAFIGTLEGFPGAVHVTVRLTNASNIFSSAVFICVPSTVGSVAADPLLFSIPTGLTFKILPLASIYEYAPLG